MVVVVIVVAFVDVPTAHGVFLSVGIGVGIPSGKKMQQKVHKLIRFVTVGTTKPLISLDQNWIFEYIG